MSAVVKLPPKVDLSTCAQLLDEIKAAKGPLTLDAVDVTNCGALGLQVLIAASRDAKKQDKEFSLINVPDRMNEQLEVMGTSPEQLMEGAI